MSTNAAKIQEIAKICKAHDAKVAPWNDRIYVNFATSKDSFRGDVTGKVWFLPSDPGHLFIEPFKGTRSPDHAVAFDGFVDSCKEAGFVVTVRS